MDETAQILGVSKAAVSTAIKRAEVREMFPDLFKNAKTQSDATKIIKGVSQQLIKREVAKRIESNKDTILTKTARNYIIGDFFKEIQKVQSETFDIVEIDPPYGIDLKKKKKGGLGDFKLGEYNEVDAGGYQTFLSKTFFECYRVMKDHSWLICWFGPEPWFEIVYQELHNAGFTTSRMCGIWVKPSGQSLNPLTRLANSYEMFFYARKGRPSLNAPGRRNIFDYSTVPPNQKVHPTERPVALMKDVYETFVPPGTRLLIPFLGSGNGIFAANELGIEAVGYDLQESYRDSFLVRLNSMK
jgi:site-specific DNA-methyltransferase (adenine-specific)